MSLGEILSKLFQQRSLSKNRFIRESGIDRSTFYQILRGKRMPTDQQMICILHYLDAGEDEEALIDLFEREKSGNEKWRNGQIIRAFLRQRPKFFDGEIQACSDQSKKILDVLCREAENGGELYAFFPLTLLKKELMNGWMLRISSICRKKFRASFFLLIEKGNEEKDTNTETLIAVLQECLACIANQNIQLNVYPDSSESGMYRNVPFPYCLIASETLLLFRADGRRITRMLRLQKPEMIAAYREHFMARQQSSAPIISTGLDYEDLASYLFRLWSGAAGKKAYLLHPRPCVAHYVTEALIERYVERRQQDFIKQYCALFRAVEFYEFVPEEGLSDFLRDRTVLENGLQMKLRQEDFLGLRGKMEERYGSRLFFIKPVSELLKDKTIVLIEHQELLILPHNGFHYMLRISEPDIVKIFSEWFSGRLSGLNNDVDLRKEWHR